MKKSRTSNSKPWVAIVWHDVQDDTNEWKHGEPGIEPVTVTTVGILYEKKKNFVVVVRDLYRDDEGGPVTGGRIAIPKGMIVSMVELEKKHDTRRNSENSGGLGERGAGEGLRPGAKEP